MNEDMELSEYESIIKEVLDSGGEFKFSPSGISMRPFLKEGSCAVVIVKPQGRLSRNDIALFKRDSGAYVLHRVMNVKDDSYDFCGDNQVRYECGVTDDMIIGVVSRVFINNKEKNLSSFGHKLYLFVWRCKLLRRCCFKLQKITGHRGKR